MKKTTTNFTKCEKNVWENGSAWQRGMVAYRHNLMNELTTDELTEIVETLEEKNFFAEMSDSYSVTLKEKAENNAIAKAAAELLNK